MASVVFYFQVHQPDRLRRYSIFDADHNYFDDYLNGSICRKVAEKCYLPANNMLLELIRRYDGRFKVCFSVTGVALDQMARYSPAVVESFKQLADTGCVEFLAETYYHSLSFLYDRDEFAEQVACHAERIQQWFGQTPTVFRNTELIYNNDLAHTIHRLGYKGIIAEGADRVLGYRSPTYLYHPVGEPELTVLCKNYRLSDDIAFRFSNHSWPEYPLTADKFARWVQKTNGNGYVVNLFMDYETVGEHQWEETGIFDFFRHLPEAIFSHGDDFATPSEVIDRHPVDGEMDCPEMISWADTERDLTAWLGNAMQSNALHELFRLASAVKATGDIELLDAWRRLQTSDHFYYMCTKYFADGDVHKYFNPYESPYDSYINFMNVLDNLASRCKGESGGAVRGPGAGSLPSRPMPEA
jgi:alpha-amylase